jgi:DNA mismatch repair ATPase MutS
MQQVNRALTLSTSRSLILVDEFGKGTAPLDGAGLFYGLLSHISNLQHKRPRFMAITHFYGKIRSLIFISYHIIDGFPRTSSSKYDGSISRHL